MQAKFLNAVAYDDRIEIFSTIGSLKRSSFEVKHALMKGGAPAVECSQLRVWCGADPNDPKKLKSCPIPDQVIEKLRRPMLVG